ncbi:MAG: ferredoxin reductase family protein [Candidatus Limnocylindrales bacterium]
MPGHDTKARADRERLRSLGAGEDSGWHQVRPPPWTNVSTITRNQPAVPLPRAWQVRTRDIVAVLVANGILIGAMWLRHGGLDELTDPSGWFIATGELTALLGGYLALVQLVLMSRSPWLEQVVGMDGLAVAHRWVGFACVWLIVAHVLLTTIGFALADGQNVIVEAWTLLTTYEFMLMAGVSLLLFIGVAVSSVRMARRHLAYETWHGLHLYAYLAIALGLGHELVTGSDFAHDPLAWAYWVGLYVVAAAMIVVFRFVEPFRVSLRHRFRVVNVEREGPGVVSIYLGGRDLDQFPIRAGQFVIVRFLAWDGWWRGHPYSISAAPNGRWLRLTVKDLGEDSTSLASLAIGTRVYLEGPYGLLTGARRLRRRVLLIAGGIGIAPLRALFEELPAGPGDLTLLYRASRPRDVVFRDELDQLARARNAVVHYLIGARGSRAMPADPLSPAALERLVPDLRRREVYLCGPTPMMEAVRDGLRAARVPRGQIHLERFEF